jgi:hypothetical protein
MSYIFNSVGIEGIANKGFRCDYLSIERTRSRVDENHNTQERTRTPNFLICKLCFWSASQVCYIRIAIRSKCPACGHDAVRSMPILVEEATKPK